MAANTINGHYISHPKSPDLKDWTCHPHDHHFLESTLARFPKEFYRGLGKNYSSALKTHSRRDANLALLRLADYAKGSPVRLTLSEEELRDLAQAQARACWRLARSTEQPATALAAIQKKLRSFGIKAPPNIKPRGIVVRSACEHWWRRQLRKIHSRHLETTALRGNIVNRFRGIYASDATVKIKQQQTNRNNALLESLQLANELGEEFSLSEIAQHSLANPTNRRAELMVRIRGFEEIAEEQGDIGVFYTITCPSKMHRSLSRSGAENPNYDGTTPREGQEYLNILWQRARASFARKGLTPYGVRVCEPQHDGTPHWHLLLFAKPDQVSQISEILHQYSLQEDGNEPGANIHRFKEEIIDKTRGSATGYIAKYISKNIDGYGIESDLNGSPADSSAIRVKAWAATWGIRQFQFIGGPPVSVWREARRISPSSQTGLLREICEAADTSNWKRFVELMGGPTCNRALQTISIFRAEKDTKNRYGERASDTILGLRQHDELAISRLHVWEVKLPRPSGKTPDQKPETPQGGLLEPEGERTSTSVSTLHGRRPCSSLEYCQ
jgi:hypothetical protein